MVKRNARSCCLLAGVVVLLFCLVLVAADKETRPDAGTVPEADRISESYQDYGRAIGDNCSLPIIVTLGLGDLPYQLTDQFTCGRGNDYDNTCLYHFDGGEDIIYELTVDADMHLSIILDPKGTTSTGIVIDSLCPAASGNCMAQSRSSAAVTHGLINVSLHASTTYYIMVDTSPTPDCISDFDLRFEYFETSPGDDCADPVVVKVPADMNGGPNYNSYIDEGQTTCGRIDDYNNTCLDEWDGGEDIIYRLDVTQAIDVDIFLDPGETNWTGILIDDNCPPDETDCIQYSVIGSGAHGLYNVSLEPGIYYIMVDTYAYPDCIPSFILTIQPVGGGPVNDDWENCIAIGDTVDLPFSTVTATPDGPGGCLTSPTIWYCYTATCTGIATFSLDGSSYLTRLGVWDGTNPFYDPLLGCEASQLELDVIQDNVYLIGVGGWGDHTGEGILNVSCAVPPENDNCEDVTPVTLSDGVAVTFTGDNTNATHQCDFFDGPHVWHAFTLDTTMIVTLDYCTTDPSFGNAWLNLAIGCPCSGVSFSGEYNYDDCGDGNLTITWNYLDAGTYYYPVKLDELAVGPYTLHVIGESIATYCKASGDCGSGEFISRVSVGEIDNTSYCDGDGYSDYTDLSATVVPGVSYPIVVELSNGLTSDIGAVWIDWNQDFIFSYGEEVDLDVFNGEGPYTGNVVPPLGASGGATTMRVRINYNSYPPSCGTTASGEVEDYTIIVNTTFICGDADGNTIVEISDAVFLINYIFVPGSPAPEPLEAGDTDCNTIVEISDAVLLISYIFTPGAPAPCDPDGDGEPDC